METLEWNVILPNINNEQDIVFNVFRSCRFLEYLMNLKSEYKKDNTIDLKEQIIRGLQYAYWAKSEYEIIAKALFGKREYKIDVYEQVKMNYDKFYDYLIANWKKIPARSYRQQRNLRDKGVNK